MKTRKLLSVIITLAMVLSLLPMTVSVSAEVDNQYVVRSWDGTNQKVTEELCDIPSGATTLSNQTAWGSGFYVASGELNLGAVTVTGDAKLILMDGCKLTVSGGIAVNEGNSLEIYAQKSGTGMLTATGTGDHVGIGSSTWQIAGNITIHGGKIIATGGEDTAGIGGGICGGCGNIVIYGGDITATGNAGGAGIGTGIGGNTSGDDGSIAIYGGTVNATGGESGAGIGGGDTAYADGVSIYGGDITAQGGEKSQAVKADTVTIGEKVEVTDGSGNLVTLSGTWAQTLTGSCYTLRNTAQPVVKYWLNGLYKDCDTYTVVTSDTKDWTGGEDVKNTGWYVVNENVTIDGNVSISGYVNLILCDGKTLTVNGNIVGYSTFSVCAQSFKETMGSLNVRQIKSYNEHNIYIYGGRVTATSGIMSARGAMVISDSIVCATGQYGLYSWNGISIVGATVTATSFESSDAGIYSKTSIGIFGGIITATGKIGIYSENLIQITDSNVTASGINNGFHSGNVLIYSGNVTAQGGEKAISFVDVDVNGTMAVYNRENERVTKSDKKRWIDVLTDKYYRFIDSSLVVPYRYYDEASGEFKDGECIDYEVIDKTHTPTKWEDGKWYVVNGEVTITERQDVYGNVHLILTDGSKLTVEDGIVVAQINNTILNIYGQEGDTGELHAGNEENDYAGIGSGDEPEGCGTVNIHGGNVFAESGNGAGIGGGYGENSVAGGTVNIYGGVVNVKSHYGAGIGGAYAYSSGIGGDGGTVKITGGTVTATSGFHVAIYGGFSACIGGGFGEEKKGKPATVTLGDNMAVFDKAEDRISLLDTGTWSNELNRRTYAKIVEKEPEPDSLTLDITGKAFTVTPSGKDSGTGIVVVALYDSADMNRLLDVKVFELEKGEKPEGTFTQAGYVKAYWWSDFEKMLPLCKPADGTIAE